MKNKTKFKRRKASFSLLDSAIDAIKKMKEVFVAWQSLITMIAHLTRTIKVLINLLTLIKDFIDNITPYF